MLFITALELQSRILGYYIRDIVVKMHCTVFKIIETASLPGKNWRFPVAQKKQLFWEGLELIVQL